jgi:CheY-like chemotaxis protein
MKILIAVGNPVARAFLEANLVDWGNDVVITCDGNKVMKALHGTKPPRIAILDFMMSCMDES